MATSAGSSVHYEPFLWMFSLTKFNIHATCTTPTCHLAEMVPNQRLEPALTQLNCHCALRAFLDVFSEVQRPCHLHSENLYQPYCVLRAYLFATHTTSPTSSHEPRDQPQAAPHPVQHQTSCYSRTLRSSSFTAPQPVQQPVLLATHGPRDQAQRVPHPVHLLCRSTRPARTLPHPGGPQPSLALADVLRSSEELEGRC